MCDCFVCCDDDEGGGGEDKPWNMSEHRDINIDNASKSRKEHCIRIRTLGQMRHQSPSEIDSLNLIYVTNNS